MTQVLNHVAVGGVASDDVQMVLNSAKWTILRCLQSIKFDLPKNSLNFVFHGGSCSSQSEIRKSIGYDIIKVNINTDT